MILNRRTAFALLACSAILLTLSLAPIASAGYEPCASTCSFKPPSAGCSCSSPYFNTTCAYYAQNGCSLYRTEKPEAVNPLADQPDLTCQTTSDLPPTQQVDEPQGPSDSPNAD